MPPGKRRGKLTGHTRAKERKANEQAARRLEEAQRRAASPRRSPSQKPRDVAHRRAEALRLIHEEGLSYRQAAKKTGTGAERLRRYAKQLEVVEPSRAGRKVRLSEEAYLEAQRVMTTFSNGVALELGLSVEEAKANARYLNAVDAYLAGDKGALRDFAGQGVTDYEGNYHPWDTSPSHLKAIASQPSKPVVYMVTKRK